MTTPATISQRQQLAIRGRHFQLVNLIEGGADGMKQRCVSGPKTKAIIAETHEDIVELIIELISYLFKVWIVYPFHIYTMENLCIKLLSYYFIMSREDNYKIKHV